MFTYLGEYKCVSQSPGSAVECCPRPTLRRPGLGPNIYLRIKIRYRYKSPFLCEVCFKYSIGPCPGVDCSHPPPNFTVSNLISRMVTPIPTDIRAPGEMVQ